MGRIWKMNNGVWCSLAAAVALGCGSSGGSSGGGGAGGGSTDLSQLEAQYTSPSGTLSAGDLPAIENALSNDAESSSVPIVTADPRSGIRVADPTSSITCNAASETGTTVTESCSCSGGGSVDISADESSSTNVAGSESYDSCSYTDSGETVLINGTISYGDYNGGQLVVYSGSLQETVTPPGTSVDLDLNYALDDDVITYSVSVSDGNVLVQATGTWDPTSNTGTFTVIDNSTTWSCSLTNGSGSCTGANGNTLNL